jgi:hypothetical protein
LGDTLDNRTVDEYVDEEAQEGNQKEFRSGSHRNVDSKKVWKLLIEVK